MSLTFDSAPLERDLHMLGFPQVRLTLSSDRPLALVCVRLCEVFPDGASKLVTRQILNLCHRESDEHPSPLVPGQAEQVVVELDAIGHVLAAGNRVRLAISPTYWPWAWPSPEPVTLTVVAGPGPLVELPEIDAGAGDRGTPFGPPEVSEALPMETLAEGQTGRTIVRNVQTGRTDMRYLWDSGGHVVYPHGMRELAENEAVYSITEGDPLSAEVVVLPGDRVPARRPPRAGRGARAHDLRPRQLPAGALACRHGGRPRGALAHLVEADPARPRVTRGR